MSNTNVQGQSGTLNVIFHGTCLFHYKNASVQAFIPVAPGEVIRAGNWLAEATLASGQYSLEGVKPVKQPLTPNWDHNLILKKELALDKPTPGKLHAIIDLKTPKKITSLHRAAFPRKVFVKRRGKNPPVSGNLPRNYRGKMSSAQVLTYGFDDDTKVFLKGPHLWEPAVDKSTGYAIINLHIISSHDREVPLQHITEAFDSLMVLVGVDMTLKLDDSPEPDRLDKVLPLGIAREESEDLANRTRRLSRLGRMRKDDRDLNQLWFKSEGLSAKDPPNCPDCWNDGN